MHRAESKQIEQILRERQSGKEPRTEGAESEMNRVILFALTKIAHFCFHRD